MNQTLMWDILIAIAGPAENGEPNGLVIFNIAERQHAEQGGMSKRRSDKVMSYLESKRKEEDGRSRANMPWRKEDDFLLLDCCISLHIFPPIYRWCCDLGYLILSSD